MRASVSEIEARDGIVRLAPPSVRWFAVVGLLLAAACGGEGPTEPEPAGPPAQLEKAEGDGQVWYFSNSLPIADAVVVRDANGRRVPGVAVTWAVNSGGGSVEAATSITNERGLATATHTLGATETSHAVTANAAGLPEVEFTASATSPPTSAAVAIGDDPPAFYPGHAVVQVGGTVTWSWHSSVYSWHNVDFIGGPTPRPASSPAQMSGTYSITFTNTGLYWYRSTGQSQMEGLVRVVN
jgi:plastocyanin